MKKLKKIEGSCAVCALHYVSGKDEDTVLRICKSYGFEPEAGMEDTEWREAAEHLGVKVRAVSLEKCSLRQFLKDYPNGVYLIGTSGHLFVVDNGVIVDPRNDKPPGLKRTVLQAWRVNGDL